MTKCQGCRSAYFPPPYVDKEKVAAGEEIDGVGTVMDTGSLAQLGAPIHLALVTIVSLSVFLAEPLIELAVR